jgi:hypothetical protein
MFPTQEQIDGRDGIWVWANQNEYEEYFDFYGFLIRDDVDELEMVLIFNLKENPILELTKWHNGDRIGDSILIPLSMERALKILAKGF